MSAWQVGSPFSDQDKPGKNDQGGVFTPWISAAWDCQSKKMADCRWFGRGKEERITSSAGLDSPVVGFIDQYASGMVITTEMQVGNAVTRVPDAYSSVQSMYSVQNFNT
jgi:hypothetical protein